ncbi:hypothetical protein DRO64_10845 [Candidatus Bathyarchaeota archaeon]|nr:MAG: hypothetical protein DRO64_10845 [Candidatus Bathyarchaeota archaeon]
MMSKKITRREWLRVTIGTVVGLVAGGIAGYYLRGMVAPPPPAVKHYRFMTYSAKVDEWFPVILYRYRKEKRPDVTVSFKRVEWLDWPVAFSSAIAAGEKLDFILYDPHWAAKYVEQGLIPDHYELFPKEFLKDWYPWTLEANVVASGKAHILVGIPYDVQTFGIYYNRKIFKDHGIEIPDWVRKEYPDALTKEEFYEVCETLKKKGIEPIAFAGGEPWYYIFPFYFAVLQYQPDPVKFAIDSMKGRIRYDGPEYQQIFEEAKRLSKYFAKGFKAEKESTAASLYVTGKTAMFIGGTWARRYMLPVAPPDFPWDVMPVPYSPPLHGGTFGGTSPSWAVLSSVKGEDLDIVIDLIKFACRDDNILTYTSICPGVGLPFKPTYKDEVLKRGLFKPPEIFEKFLKISQFAKVWLDWVYEPEIVTAINTETSNVIAGVHTPKEAAKEVQRVHEKLVKEGKAYYPQE